jgi:hypothetical protein
MVNKNRNNKELHSFLREGSTAVEFMMASVILGLALMPIFGIFGSSRKATFKSRVSYMAIHVARERLEELRQLPFMMLEELSDNGWESAEGNVFRHTIEQRNSRAIPVTVGGTSSTGITVGGVAVSAGSAASGSFLQGEDGSFDYPEEYARIWTRIAVAEIPRRDYAPDAPADDTTSLQFNIKPVRLKRVTIDYYWQERGEEIDEARLKNTNTITTIIASHNIE